MRRIGTAVLLSVLGALLVAGVAGCSSSAATTPSGSAAATTAASPSASASKAAWVRGTKVTLTNSSGSAVEYATKVGDLSATPEVPNSALADGASAAETDAWHDASSSGIFYRVKYPDGKVAEFLVANPAIGSPYVNYRTGPLTLDWQNYSYDNITPDEGASETVTVADHSITFNHQSDDGDYKMWTVTLE